MKKTAAAILLCASTAIAGPSIESPRAPFPPAGQTGVALCPGQDPCADLDLIEYDLAADCWNCLVPGTDAWEACASAPAIEAIGPVYIGEGSVSPCDGCAAAGAGDLVVRGGNVYFTAALDNLLAPCTLDAADTSSLQFGGGGARAGTRGAWGFLGGNEWVTVGELGPGDVFWVTGNVANATATIRSLSTTGAVVLELEQGATDTEFLLASTGPAFVGAVGEDILITDPLNLYAAASRAETLCNAAFDMAANPSSAFWAGQHGSELGYYTDGAFTAGCTTAWGDNLATWSGDMVMRASTSDGADDSTLHLYGGGGGNSDRGASFRISGNEDGGNAGWLEGFTGDATGAGINFGAFGATSSSFSVDVDTTPTADQQTFAIGSGAAYTDYSFSFYSQSGKPMWIREGVELMFEGDTADANESLLAATDATQDNLARLPDYSGSIHLTSRRLSQALYEKIAVAANTALIEVGTDANGNGNTGNLTFTAASFADAHTATGNFLSALTAATSGTVARYTATTYNQEGKIRRDWSPVWATNIRLGAAAFSSFRYWVGIFASTPEASSTPTIDGMAFRGDDSLNADWDFCTNDGSDSTWNCTDTNVTMTNTGTYVMEIVASGSTVYGYINGALVATHTTDLPTSTDTLNTFVGVTARANEAKGIGIDSITWSYE